jgi:3-deoxy-D-manno-octulosonic-acid transferase
VRSADEDPDADTQIYIADLEGELGMWLRIAPVTFLGGSLAGSGNCLNPRAVAELGSVIIHGPSSAPHKAYLGQMDTGRAARVVRDGTGLSNVLNALSSPDKVAELAHNAWDIATQNADATLKVAQLVGAALPATGTDGGADAGT